MADNTPEINAQERNLALAAEFAAKLAPFKATSCGVKNNGAVAAGVDPETGFGVTATWTETRAGTVFSAYIERVGKPDDADTVANEFRKILVPAAGLWGAATWGP